MKNTNHSGAKFFFLRESSDELRAKLWLDQLLLLLLLRLGGGDGVDGGVGDNAKTELGRVLEWGGGGEGIQKGEEERGNGKTNAPLKKDP